MCTKPKNALDKLKPLLQAPSFTSKDARLRGVSSSTLAYYVRQHEPIHIGHGTYRSTNAPANIDFRWEDLIEVAKRGQVPTSDMFYKKSAIFPLY